MYVCVGGSWWGGAMCILGVCMINMYLFDMCLPCNLISYPSLIIWVSSSFLCRHDTATWNFLARGTRSLTHVNKFQLFIYFYHLKIFFLCLFFSWTNVKEMSVTWSLKVDINVKGSQCTLSAMSLFKQGFEIHNIYNARDTCKLLRINSLRLKADDIFLRKDCLYPEFNGNIIELNALTVRYHVARLILRPHLNIS